MKFFRLKYKTIECDSLGKEDVVDVTRRVFLTINTNTTRDKS